MYIMCFCVFGYYTRERGKGRRRRRCMDLVYSRQVTVWCIVCASWAKFVFLQYIHVLQCVSTCVLVNFTLTDWIGFIIWKCSTQEVCTHPIPPTVDSSIRCRWVWRPSRRTSVYSWESRSRRPPPLLLYSFTDVFSRIRYNVPQNASLGTGQHLPLALVILYCILVNQQPSSETPSIRFVQSWRKRFCLRVWYKDTTNFPSSYAHLWFPSEMRESYTGCN